MDWANKANEMFIVIGFVDYSRKGMKSFNVLTGD